MTTFDILASVLFLIGAVQGIVFGVMLSLDKSPNRSSNGFMAILLFFLSYRLLVQTMILAGFGRYDTWYYFMVDVNWIHGTLLYFFVRARVEPSFRLAKKDWIHFFPVALQLTCSVFVRMQNIYWDGTRESLSWLGYWGYVVWMNYPTVHFFAGLLILLYASRAIRLLRARSGMLDSKQPPTWLWRMLRTFQVFFLGVLLVLLADLLLDGSPWTNAHYYFSKVYYYPFFAGLAILTYTTAIIGFNKRNVLDFKHVSSMSEEEKETLRPLADQLIRLMNEDAVYKDPELTLSSLSERLEVKSYLLSKCLNEVFEESFSDHINRHRVEELQRLLSDSSNDQFTLLGLAYDAGFNSKSAFHRAVKKQLGVSPGSLRAAAKGPDS